jgi:DNA-binding NarL/FixJ family response regulator
MTGTVENPIRILLVDDHASVRAGYRILLEAQAGMKVVAEAGKSDEALAIAEREPLDIILLDLDLGAKSPERGLDIIRKLNNCCPHARVLILTGVNDLMVHQEAARRGAMGLVNKEESVDQLVKAIEKVHSGEPWFDRTLLGSILAERSGGTNQENPEIAKIKSLTDRELEIVKWVAEGLKNKEIGQRLNPHIGETTVRNHLNTIFNKLDVASRFELLLYAYRHSLAKPPTL